MNKEDIRSIIEETLINDYDVDIRGWTADTPISKIREASPKLDSLEFLQFIFNIEDKTGIDLPEGTSPPTTIGEFLDAFYTSSLKK